MHFVQGNSNHNYVKPKLIKCLYSFLQSNILFEFDRLCFADGSENPIVDELLSKMILSANPNKNPVKKPHLILSMFFSGILKHRFGECSDDEGDYFLEGKPMY